MAPLVRLGVPLHPAPLRPDDEVAEVHTLHEVVQVSGGVPTQPGIRLRSVGRLGDLARTVQRCDQLESRGKQPLGQRLLHRALGGRGVYWQTDTELLT